MGQVTLYLDGEPEAKMKAAAQAAGVSRSREKTAAHWPDSVAKLAGAWSDEDFPSIEEIRSRQG